MPEAAGADGVLALLTTKVDGDYLDGAGSQLAIVANYAVGVDNVDLDAARDRGVQIANTPDVLTKATAELAIALALALLRRVAEGDRFIRERTTSTSRSRSCSAKGSRARRSRSSGRAASAARRPGWPRRSVRGSCSPDGATTSMPCSRPRTSSACTAR